MAINLGGVLAGFSQAVSDKIVKEDEARRELETYEKKTEIQSAANQRTAAANRAYQDKKQAKEMAGLINYYFTDPKLNKAMSNMPYSYQAAAVEEAENLANEGYSLQSFMTLSDSIEGGMETAQNIVIDRAGIKDRKRQGEGFSSWQEGAMQAQLRVDELIANGASQDKIEAAEKNVVLYTSRAEASKTIDTYTSQNSSFEMVNNLTNNYIKSLNVHDKDAFGVSYLPEGVNDGLQPSADIVGGLKALQFTNILNRDGTTNTENMAANKYIYNAATTNIENGIQNAITLSNARFGRWQKSVEGVKVLNGNAQLNLETGETAEEGLRILSFSDNSAFQEQFPEGLNSIGSYNNNFNVGDTVIIKVGGELKRALYVGYPNPSEGGAPYIPLR